MFPSPRPFPNPPAPPRYAPTSSLQRAAAEGLCQCHGCKWLSSEGLPWSSLGYLYPSVEHRLGIVPVSPQSASNRFHLVPVAQYKALCCNMASERQKQCAHFLGNAARFYTKLHICHRFNETTVIYFIDRLLKDINSLVASSAGNVGLKKTTLNKEMMFG